MCLCNFRELVLNKVLPCTRAACKNQFCNPWSSSLFRSLQCKFIKHQYMCICLSNIEMIFYLEICIHNILRVLLFRLLRDIINNFFCVVNPLTAMYTYNSRKKFKYMYLFYKYMIMAVNREKTLVFGVWCSNILETIF